MANLTHKTIWADAELIEAIGSFPLAKEIDHCGSVFSVNPFEFNATCPTCGAEIKLRSFSALYELEEICDNVFLPFRILNVRALLPNNSLDRSAGRVSRNLID